MKTTDEIYDDIKSDFYDKSGIDIQENSAIDYFNLSVSSSIETAYEEIKNNRTPHLYSGLTGSDIDDLGILVGISRETNETDKSYLYRTLKWNISNKASNSTAIEDALINLTYSSHVTPIPKAFGCGTQAFYIIPTSMDDTTKSLAISEVQTKLKNVIDPSMYVEYIIPTIIYIKMQILYRATSADIDTIKDTINESIIEYINGIAPGDYLEVGKINNIGDDTTNISYFNVAHLFVNDEEIGDIELLQTVEKKFLITSDNITWLEV
jgi:hypothetical protein